jgi:putative chitinase
MINFKKFYDAYRKQFGRIRKDGTVESIDSILTVFNQNWDNEKVKTRRLEKMAYMLATVRHEVGRDMIPIVESLYYTSASRIAQVWPSRFTTSSARAYTRNAPKLANKVYSNRLGNGSAASGDGFKYRGRGIGAQLTGKVNYKKFSKILGIDLVSYPNKAMDTDVGAQILFIGCTRGNLTGRALSRYINNKRVDYKNARRVVNADVRLNGARIAKDARKFLKVLEASVEHGVNHIPEMAVVENKMPDLAEVSPPKQKPIDQAERKKEIVDNRSTARYIYDKIRGIFK